MSTGKGVGLECGTPRCNCWPSHTSDLKTGIQVAIPCRMTGVVGSVLGLVGPVSAYCDLARCQV